MEKVKIVLDMNDFENELVELKLHLHGDTCSKHRIIEEDNYYIIELRDDDSYTSSKELLYGRIIEDKLYIGRIQRIESIKYNQIDFYDEFFCNGQELSFK